MYQVWSNFLNPGQIAMLGIVVTFLLTFLALKHPFSFLPSDHGREFAVNGGLSRGKLRGVGLVIVICFLIGSVLFLPLGAEYAIYAILLVCIMLSGYLDDASETPWSDYKKGAIDLVISIVTVITFVNYNSTTIYFGSMSLTIPKVVYIILGIILIWISINVTNCSDGVDGTKKRRRVQRGGYDTAYCQFHIIIKYTARETNVKYQTKKNKKITKN